MLLRPAPILLTGGSGRLGCELKQLLPDLVAPAHCDLDVTSFDSVNAAINQHNPKVLVHAAAFTNVARAETDRESCWNVNVEGTRNVVRAASRHDIFLIHISTDYVFEGTRGMYLEDDVVGPVANYYALTKLVAEQVVRTAERHLIIRTSFRPRQWPYPTAFSDVYTSQDYVDVIAPDVALAIAGYEQIPYKTLHIATERKTVFELAARRKPDVLPGTRMGAGVSLPADVSLDVQRWTSTKANWKGLETVE